MAQLAGTSQRQRVTARLREALVAGANPNGGWGYHAGKTSRIEPTCWALWALTDRAGGASRPHRRFLSNRREPGGLLVDPGAPSPNVAFNGLAALLSLTRPHAADTDLSTALIPLLASSRGLGFDNHPLFRQDNSLQAWPWVEETFSWVEPTAWCLLALKRHAREGADDEWADLVVEADRMLLDRCFRSGGWNYGNSNAFGKDLIVFGPTTALALLALQDQRDDPRVARSLGRLYETRMDEPSGMALALTALCLRVYALQSDDVEQRLAEQFDRTSFLSNLHVIAMALYVLTGPTHGYADFTL